jgi:rhomboid protease GluP
MKRFPVTFGLVLLIVLVFLAQLRIDFTHEQQGPLPHSFREFAITQELDPIRFVAGTFMHAGLLHLVMNLWMLLQVGTVFELLFGSVRLAIIYAVSALTGALASCMYLDPEQVSVGASGAIFGVAGALVVMIGAMAQRHRWASSLRLQLAAWAIATLILGQVSPDIDNAAHIGGLIAGGLAGLLARSFVTTAPIRDSRAR